MAKIKTRIKVGLLNINFPPDRPKPSLDDRCVFYVQYKKYWWQQWRYVREGGQRFTAGCAIFYTRAEAEEVTANIEQYI